MNDAMRETLLEQAIAGARDNARATFRGMAEQVIGSDWNARRMLKIQTDAEENAKPASAAGAGGGGLGDAASLDGGTQEALEANERLKNNKYGLGQ
jgi:hypothetical protein